MNKHISHHKLSETKVIWVLTKRGCWMKTMKLHRYVQEQSLFHLSWPWSKKKSVYIKTSFCDSCSCCIYNLWKYITKMFLWLLPHPQLCELPDVIKVLLIPSGWFHGGELIPCSSHYLLCSSDITYLVASST